MKFSRKDLVSSVISGFITGSIAFGVFKYLQIPAIFNISFVWLMLVVPLLWILGVNLGYFLGRWLNFFNQFGKYAAIGFTNAAVDFGVLYFLLDSFGVVAGKWYAIIKATSFIVATIHSYLWNKYWVFNAGDSGKGKSEFAKFLTVSAASLLINVVVATSVVAFIHPIFNIGLSGWAGVGAIAGSAAALIFSFTGFRLAVFKK